MIMIFFFVLFNKISIIFDDCDEWWGVWWDIIDCRCV